MSELTLAELERSMKNIKIQDYKVTSVWSVIPTKDNPNGYKEDWEYQLNSYAWLGRKNGYRAKKLQIIAILRDHQKSKGFQSYKEKGNYPYLPIKVIDIPLWTDEEQDKYVLDRVETHQEADMLFHTLDRQIDCTDKERWKKQDEYAVKVPNLKKAKKLFTNLEEAELFKATVPKSFVEFRKGNSNRCAQYCSVVNFCKQAKGEGYGKKTA
tara:strand:+ start:97 stop:729 length:633 start_codon:yes stop_codon:yes gene_type:complete